MHSYYTDFRGSQIEFISNQIHLSTFQNQPPAYSIDITMRIYNKWSNLFALRIKLRYPLKYVRKRRTNIRGMKCVEVSNLNFFL